MDIAAEATFNVPKRGLIKPNSPDNYQRYKRIRADYDNRSKKFDRLIKSYPVETPRQPSFDYSNAAAAGIGTLGAASPFLPALAPVAAAAGLGYAVYKLGDSFNLW